MKTKQKVLFAIWIIVIIGILGAASRYLSFKVTGLLNTKPDELLSSEIYLSGFYSHVIFGMLALLLGPTQFIPGLRKQALNFHRWSGRVYVFSCFVGGLAGFYIAFHATSGIIASVGFIGLATSWLYTTFRAFQSIRNKEIKNHQIWMIRSFSLTMAAVTLRIYLGFMLTLGLDFYVAYPIVAWISWIPNLILAENIWVRRLESKVLIT